MQPSLPRGHRTRRHRRRCCQGAILRVPVEGNVSNACLLVRRGLRSDTVSGLPEDLMYNASSSPAPTFTLVPSLMADMDRILDI